MSLVVIGRIGRIHGLRGEVALDGSSLDARELSAIGQFTWRSARGETLPLTLEAARPVHAGMLVRFAGYEDRHSAKGWLSSLTLTGLSVTSRDLATGCQ